MEETEDSGKSSEQLLNELVAPTEEANEETNDASAVDFNLNDDTASSIGDADGVVLDGELGDNKNNGVESGEDNTQVDDPNLPQLQLPFQLQPNQVLNFAAAISNMPQQQQQPPPPPQGNTMNPFQNANPFLLLAAAQANPALVQNLMSMVALGAAAGVLPLGGFETFQQTLLPPQAQEEEIEEEKPQPKVEESGEQESQEQQQEEPPPPPPQEQQQQSQFLQQPQLDLLRLLTQSAGMLPAMQSFNPMVNLVPPNNSVDANTAGANMTSGVVNFNNNTLFQGNNPVAAFPVLQQFVPAMLAQQQQQQQPIAPAQLSSQAQALQAAQLSASCNASSSGGAAAAHAASSPHYRPAIPLYLDHDENCLTPYQCFLRKQIELFEAGDDELEGTAQGRNTPLHRGQIGIRCRHCAHLPKAARSRGGVYYSRSIEGCYQVAQNMCKLHFLKSCSLIPPSTKSQLQALQSLTTRASGGKEYWAEGLRVLGVVEDVRGFLKFQDRKSSSSSTTTKSTDGSSALKEE
ncbi:MAG: hypothetical protein SGILL_000159 [Bacillariaceae sp.]